jgi:hypothetical protein
MWKTVPEGTLGMIALRVLPEELISWLANIESPTGAVVRMKPTALAEGGAGTEPAGSQR